MMNVYGLVVLLLVLTAGITISYTFLFNINEIRVAGQSDMYSAEEIVEASGIKKGDNLLRLDCAKSEQRILDKLLYVETAKVDRDFPSSLDITVTKCIPAFNVNYGDGTLLVSKKGKILADNGFITDGLPIIYGFDPADHTPGKPASSENEHKNDAFFELISSMSAKEDNGIMTVDMSDEHAIVVNYKNGMIFKMGNWNDVEYKLNLADTVMNDETVKGKKGYLTMIGTKQCSFRTSDGPVIVPGEVEPTTEPMTDEYGYPIIQSEHDPKQEEMLNEFNNNRNTTEPTTAAQQWTDNSSYDDGSNWGDNSWDQQDNQWSADNSWTDQTTQWSDNSGNTAGYDNNSENQW
jgi:cell division protein FtsQ